MVITVHVNLILRNTLISDQTSFACAQRHKRNRTFSSKKYDFSILLPQDYNIELLAYIIQSDASRRLYKSSSKLRVKQLMVVDVHILVAVKELNTDISTCFIYSFFFFLVVQFTQSKVKCFLFEALFAIHPNRTYTPCCQVLLIIPSAF